MGRRIQGRLLLLLGLRAIRPALGLGRAASDAQAAFDREVAAERKLRAAEIGARLDDRLSVELGYLEAAAARSGTNLDGVTAGRRSPITRTLLVDAQGHSAGVPAKLVAGIRQGGGASVMRE